MSGSASAAPSNALIDAIRLKEAMDSITGIYTALGSLENPPRAAADSSEEDAGEENGDDSLSQCSGSSVDMSDTEEVSEKKASDGAEVAESYPGKRKDPPAQETKAKKKRTITLGWYTHLMELLGTYDRSSVTSEDYERLLPKHASHHHLHGTGRPELLLTVKVPSIADGSCDYSGPIHDVPKELLREWWEKAHVSGYGNMRTQTTEVDATVRDAREWKSDEISVSGVVTDTLAVLWGRMLQPADVRVELYKLNIYGPGGHFSAHRDTSQTDLVGTILIGLGDTTDVGAGLRLEGRTHLWKALPGGSIFFYPDVTHAVCKVTEGFRATLAFKVFAVRSSATLAARDAVLKSWHSSRSKFVEAIEAKMLGVEFELRAKWFPFVASRRRSYETLSPEQQQELETRLGDCRSRLAEAIRRWSASYEGLGEVDGGSATGTGSDSTKPRQEKAKRAFTFSATQARMRARCIKSLSTCELPFGFLLDHEYALGTEDLVGPDAVLYDLLCSIPRFRVVVMPVLTQYSGSCDVSDSGDHDETAEVYPLTEAHVRGALPDGNKPDLHTACGVTRAEAEQMQGVRFFASSLRSGYEWKRVCEQGALHTGNESRSAEEDSVWLHRAIVVVERREDTEEMAD
jgi:hypothetical protein